MTIHYCLAYPKKMVMILIISIHALHGRSRVDQDPSFLCIPIFDDDDNTDYPNGRLLKVAIQNPFL